LAKLKKKNLLYTCLFLFIIFLTEEKKAELTQLWSQHNNNYPLKIQVHFELKQFNILLEEFQTILLFIVPYVK
jgi:hypothetical protein